MLRKIGWGNVIQIFDSIANNIHSRKICLHDIKFLALEKNSRNMIHFGVKYDTNTSISLELMLHNFYLRRNIAMTKTSTNCSNILRYIKMLVGKDRAKNLIRYICILVVG